MNNHLIHIIIQFLEIKEIISLSKTNKNFNNVMMNSITWKSILIRDFENFLKTEYIENI